MRLTERQKQVYVWRNSGMTFREIGERLGVTRERARQVFLRSKLHVEKPDFGTDGRLSLRACCALHEYRYYEGLEPDRETFRADWLAGRIDPVQWRHVGPVTVQELRDWAGVEGA